VAEPRQRPKYGYFSVGDPRWFVATKSDVGLYLKPGFSAGYGMPHWLSASVDVNGVLTIEMFQAFAGVRAATPVLDLSFGYRHIWSFSRPFLVPARSYTGEDVSGAPGPSARYWAWEGEAAGVVPLPHSALILDFILIKLLDIPPSSYVYEEAYRAVVTDGMYAVMRTGAVARLMREDALKVGVLSEVIVGGGRGRNVTRVGPIVALQLTDHLEALGLVTFAVASPDQLGLTLGAYGIASVRYRWATGEPNPKLPWAEPLIPF
jgi:hypothetical protein